MDKIQLIFFFANGFLISRLFLKTHIPERIVHLLIADKSLSLGQATFYIIGFAAFFSFFIPNAITVLTLLPILTLFRRVFIRSGAPVLTVSTMLTLAVIYGANIGGMGSITATPANGILATFIALRSVPAGEKLTFATWLVWGIPLVVVFVMVAWGVLVLSFRSWRFQLKKIRMPFTEEQHLRPHQPLVIWLTGLYFSSSIILSALIMGYPRYDLAILIFTGALSIAFIGFVFFYSLPSENGSAAPLLRIADCYGDLPLRGFLFVGIAVILGGVMYALNASEYFGRLLPYLLPAGLGVYGMLLIIALVTSFATEILSNTVVQVAMFLIIQPLSESLGFPGLLAMIIATLSSTSAFMSPIATGVNGLAFGGMRGVSLMLMLAVGLVMNVLGGLLVSCWSYFFIGWLYGL